MKEKKMHMKAADLANCLYQVSTLQALTLGYLRSVVSVGELLAHGDIGLGTFLDLDGEMIIIDGSCYRALHDGTVVETDMDFGTPFAVVGQFKGARAWDWDDSFKLDELLAKLNKKVEAHFGLNSMHVVRIDGLFEWVDARSEHPSRQSQHVSMSKLLATTQEDFRFENIRGSLVGFYFPNYMDGINMPGWHLHFISQDRSVGGHVFDAKVKKCHVSMDKVARLEIQIPTEAQFDTYNLKLVSQDDINAVEQA